MKAFTVRSAYATSVMFCWIPACTAIMIECSRGDFHVNLQSMLTAAISVNNEIDDKCGLCAIGL
jgi:hypothetical protein